MPAFRGKNLRSGDLAEQLGILLLQSVALVAPVPRTEDVGIDVVATLIRSFDGNKYIAEDSFFVQIKSASITDIAFNKNEISWLTSLRLPFFIASVDRKTSSVKLYSSYTLFRSLIINPNIDQITFQLSDLPFDENILDMASSSVVQSGPAVIEWSLNTIEMNNNFIELFYALLKKHVQLLQLSVNTNGFGSIDLVVWETGKEPVIYGKEMKPVGTFDEMIEMTSPYLHMFLHRISQGEDLGLTRTLYRLFEKVLEHHGHFETIDGRRVLIKYTIPKSK